MHGTFRPNGLCQLLTTLWAIDKDLWQRQLCIAHQVNLAIRIKYACIFTCLQLYCSIGITCTSLQTHIHLLSNYMKPHALYSTAPLTASRMNSQSPTLASCLATSTHPWMLVNLYISTIMHICPLFLCVHKIYLAMEQYIKQVAHHEGKYVAILIIHMHSFSTCPHNALHLSSIRKTRYVDRHLGHFQP